MKTSTLLRSDKVCCLFAQPFFTQLKLCLILDSRRSVSVAFYHSTCLSLNTLLDQGKAPAIDYAPGAWLDYDQTVILGGHPGSFKIAYPGSLRLPGSNEARPVAVKQAVVWSRQRKWELVSPAEQVSNLIREFRTQEFAKVAHAHCLTVLARLQSIDPVKYRAALLPATLPRFADCWLAKTPAGNCFLVEELIPIWAGKFLNNNGKAKEPQTHGKVFHGCRILLQHTHMLILLNSSQSIALFSIFVKCHNIYSTSSPMGSSFCPIIKANFSPLPLLFFLIKLTICYRWLRHVH